MQEGHARGTGSSCYHSIVVNLSEVDVVVTEQSLKILISGLGDFEPLFCPLLC